MLKYYQVNIVETARNHPRDDVDDDMVFNTIKEEFYTESELFRYLEHRYGKNFTTSKKMYVDKFDGKTYECGFVKSFWNKDWSHDSKSWWQTDWVSVVEMQATRKAVRCRKLIDIEGV